jgi:hypothetical protein
MTTPPRELLTEAGATLARAEALIAMAAVELGPPFTDPLETLAADVERTRRKLRTSTITATGP